MRSMRSGVGSPSWLLGACSCRVLVLLEVNNLVDMGQQGLLGRGL